MAKAKQLPSGSWRVQVYAGKDAAGKKQYLSFTALTKKEAEYNALQWQLHYKEVSRDSSAMTLDEAMQKYIASKDSILSPSTIRGYEGIQGVDKTTKTTGSTRTINRATSWASLRRPERLPMGSEWHRSQTRACTAG